MAKKSAPEKPQILKDGSKELPSRSALMALAKGKKTINDYSKSAPSINDYPTSGQG